MIADKKMPSLRDKYYSQPEAVKVEKKVVEKPKKEVKSKKK